MRHSFPELWNLEKRYTSYNFPATPEHLFAMHAFIGCTLWIIHWREVICKIDMYFWTNKICEVQPQWFMWPWLSSLELAAIISGCGCESMIRIYQSCRLVPNFLYMDGLISYLCFMWKFCHVIMLKNYED